VKYLHVAIGSTFGDGPLLKDSEARNAGLNPEAAVSRKWQIRRADAPQVSPYGLPLT
jgi:hypothetical protein